MIFSYFGVSLHITRVVRQLSIFGISFEVGMNQHGYQFNLERNDLHAFNRRDKQDKSVKSLLV